METYSTNYRDYHENYENLIGKIVIYKYGWLYGGKDKSLHTIETIQHNGFTISDHPDKLFNFAGYELDMQNPNDIHLTSKCDLMSPATAITWRRNAEIVKMKVIIKSKILDLNHDKLVKIMEIINS